MPKMDREKLIALARQIVDREGGQVATAELLGVSQAYIALALSVDPESPKRDKILMRIVSEVGGKCVEKRVVVEVG